MKFIKDIQHRLLSKGEATDPPDGGESWGQSPGRRG